MLVSCARAGILLSVHCVCWSQSRPATGANRVECPSACLPKPASMFVNGGQIQTLAGDIAVSRCKLCAKEGDSAASRERQRGDHHRRSGHVHRQRPLSALTSVARATGIVTGAEARDAFHKPIGIFRETDGA